jgi:hypothetical protein
VRKALVIPVTVKKQLLQPRRNLMLPMFEVTPGLTILDGVEVAIAGISVMQLTIN